MAIVKRLVFYSDKILDDKKFLLVSDIHKQMGEVKHLRLVKKHMGSEFRKLDYIIIPGDIVNNAEDLNDKEFRNKLQEELLDFSEEKKTIVSIGNHDQMILLPSKKWKGISSELIFKVLRELDNFRVLKNGESIVEGEIAFSSFTPSIEYYIDYKEDMRVFEKEFYQNYNERLFDEKNYNIFLTHDPQSIIKLSRETNKCIQPYADLVLSGHMHNGLLPNILHGLCKNRGILSPQMELFPEFAHGIYQIGDTTFVINGALNTIIEIPIINNLYGYNATVIDVKRKKKCNDN